MRIEVVLWNCVFLFCSNFSRMLSSSHCPLIVAAAVATDLLPRRRAPVCLHYQLCVCVPRGTHAINNLISLSPRPGIPQFTDRPNATHVATTAAANATRSVFFSFFSFLDSFHIIISNQHVDPYNIRASRGQSAKQTPDDRQTSFPLSPFLIHSLSLTPARPLDAS